MQSPDRARIEDYVEWRHSEIVARNDAGVLPQPRRIAELASALSRRHLAGLQFHLDKEHLRSTAELLGWLFFAMDKYGSTFDDICELAGAEIAQALAVLTPDHRLPGPRRNLDWLSRIGQADDVTRLAKLAEAAATYEALRGLSDAELLRCAAPLQYWQQQLELVFKNFQAAFRHSCYVSEDLATLMRCHAELASRLARPATVQAADHRPPWLRAAAHAAPRRKPRRAACRKAS